MRSALSRRGPSTPTSRAEWDWAPPLESRTMSRTTSGCSKGGRRARPNHHLDKRASGRREPCCGYAARLAGASSGLPDTGRRFHRRMADRRLVSRTAPGHAEPRKDAAQTAGPPGHAAGAPGGEWLAMSGPHLVRIGLRIGPRSSCRSAPLRALAAGPRPPRGRRSVGSRRRHPGASSPGFRWATRSPLAALRAARLDTIRAAP